MSELFARLKKLIAERLEVDEAKVVPEASFIEDLGADSLDAVELVMKVEEVFEIEIPDGEAEKLKTVQDIYNHLVAKGK